jgi:hypothetical protein
MSPEDEGELERNELEAVLEARRELGPRYDAALVESFADRVEAAIVQRVSAEAVRRDAAIRARSSAGPRQLALGIVTAVAGVPVTAITLAVPEDGVVSLVSLVASWTGLVWINLAHARQSRLTD